MNRFDSVEYGEVATKVQDHLKSKFISIEEDLKALADCREKALALTKLEESYMWVGKALRDAQLKVDERN